jgi:hypothetical protein
MDSGPVQVDAQGVRAESVADQLDDLLELIHPTSIDGDSA